MKSVIVSTLLSISLLLAQDSLRYPTSIQPPFDVKEAVRQFAQMPSVDLDEPPTFLLDTFAAYVPALDAQSNASIAYDGTNYLVVWHDGRSGYLNGDIYGARVDKNGRALDPAGFPICRRPNHQGYPSVAFDGGNYLVVWQDARIDTAYDVYGARVNRAGKVLDTVGIPISPAVHAQKFPSVAFDGRNFLVVWQDCRGNGSTVDIYASRVSSAGTVVDAAGIIVSAAGGNQVNPSIASDATSSLVVWQDYRSNPSYSDIYGARVSQSGTVLEPAGVSISVANKDQRCPALVFGVADYLVLWNDFRGSDSSDIYGARVSRTGVVLDTAGIVISALANRQEYPSGTFDGVNYFVVWGDEHTGPRRFDIYGARVSQSGAVVDTEGIAISIVGSNEGLPAVGYDGSRYFVAWDDWRGGGWDIYGARVAKDGNVIDSAGIVVSFAATDQRYPSVAFDSTNYLAVWQEWRGNTFDIYGSRATSLGALVDERGFPISTASGWQWYPAVASDGMDHLVVWQDHRANASYGDIYGARVTWSGMVLDPEGIPIATVLNERTPALAHDGTNYLVVWMEGTGGTSIFGSRVDRQGCVIDTNAVAISVTGLSRAPSVTFGNTNYFVVWSQSENIYGARVSIEGVVLDPGGIVISAAARAQNLPQAAFDGNDYMVVWHDQRSGSLDIYCSRVSRDGVVLDTGGIAVSTAPGHQASAAIAFDGCNYVIMWEDYRSNAYGDIYGARVTKSGVVVDSFAVFNEATAELVPTIVYGRDGRCLVAYYGWTDSLKHKPAYTFRVWGLLTQPMSAIEAGAPAPTFIERLEIHPNPFRGQTKIELGTAHGAKSMELRIYDVSGRMVKSFPLASRTCLLATSSIAWDGTDDRGAQLPAGVYFCRLGKHSDCVTRKVVKLE